MLRRWTSFYGANPLHLLVLIGCFALAGYAVWRVIDNPSLPRMALWFVGAVIAHDLILFPLYALADRSLSGALRALRALRRGRDGPRVPVLNHVRVPALGAGLTFLLFFPGIVGQGSGTHRAATGLAQEGYAARWLLLVAALFLVSALVYAIRARRYRAGSSSRATTP
ncbi:hypothetical protein [Haloechinothrix halophila]|uniref:hypothetical protein n=1 Tax=Haloechinothrix halophila TaxID=1069073 RepID=UPI000556EA39|nr:hypothetical protein [Haloechinothrix halophila]